MKKKNIAYLIGILIFYPPITGAQKNTNELSKYQLKYQKQQSKVDKAETRVVYYQDKIQEADSLIEIGKRLQKEARLEEIRIRKKESKFLKVSNKELKEYVKMEKEATVDELKELRDLKKEIDERYKEGFKEIEDLYKEAYYKMQKGLQNEERGRSKIQQYKPYLKSAIDKLKVEIDELEEYKEILADKG
ncbi:hypothetical protein ACFLSA_02930 [Bacteroidota bacterium]